MLRRAASVAARASARHSRLFRNTRSFASSVEDPASLAALRNQLLDEQDTNFPIGFAPGLRQDEWAHPSGKLSFWLLRRNSTPINAHFDPGIPVGTGVNADVLASVIKQGDVLLGGASAMDGLGPVAVTSVVQQALRSGMCVDTVECLVALPGLCEFVAKRELWADAAGLAPAFDAAFGDLDDVSKTETIEASLASAKAIALGVPRPGHSVLGHGTFKAAEPAWKGMALQYLSQKEEIKEEVEAYERALAMAFPGKGVRVAAVHMANTDPEYMADAGGAMAVVTAGGSTD